MAQAAVAFLKNQYVERDGGETPFFAGAWGIFGHGNVAGIGQALQQNPGFPLLPVPQRAGDGPHRHGLRQDEEPAADLRLHHRPSGRARPTWSPARPRATINRIPVLLLPGDIFARRNVAPCSSNSNPSTARTSRVNDASSPSRATGTASIAPISCCSRCPKPCAC